MITNTVIAKFQAKSCAEFGGFGLQSNWNGAELGAFQRRARRADMRILTLKVSRHRRLSRHQQGMCHVCKTCPICDNNNALVTLFQRRYRIPLFLSVLHHLEATSLHVALGNPVSRVLDIYCYGRPHYPCAAVTH